MAARKRAAEKPDSGPTLGEPDGGGQLPNPIRAELGRLGAPRHRVRAQDVSLTLAEIRDRPFSAKGWIFELKYDGYRIVAGLDRGEPELVYRRGGDATSAFPEIARALRSLPFSDLVLDGEAVVLDESSRSSFQRLQKRALLQRRTDIERMSVLLPATYYTFDLLGFEDFDLRGLSVTARKRLLERLLPKTGPIRYLDHVEEQGEAFYREVEKLGLEGIVAKKADAPYRGRRTADWLKIRVDRVDDFVVVGFTDAQGGRNGFGALHLAQYEGDRLVYAGRAGSGFDEALLDKLRTQLDLDRRPACPCEGAPTGRGHTWVEPRLVAEVRFKERTEEGLLRQPVFLRLRGDKAPSDCVRPAASREC